MVAAITLPKVLHSCGRVGNRGVSCAPFVKAGAGGPLKRRRLGVGVTFKRRCPSHEFCVFDLVP
jgi:hypothetical protein